MHSIPSTPAAAALNPQGHFCGICNKQFDRRDLRDRHKRRCIKSSARTPTSKRKSCLPCVRSKVRCDATSPTCSRCREKGKECRYTTVPLSSHSGEGVEEAPGMGDLSGGIGENGTTEIRGIGPIDGFATDVALEGLPDGDFAHMWDTTLLSETFQYDNSAWDMASTLQDGGSSEEWFRDIGLSPGSFDRRSSEEIMINQPSWSTQSPTQDLVQSPKSARAPTPSFGALISLDTPSSSIPTTAPPPLRLPVSTILSFILSIPAAMLNPSTTPPFIHHHLYPCSSPTVDSVPCPISVAFCLLKAHEAAVRSSMPFVQNTMDQERSRLIQQFDSQNGHVDVMGVLAGVHALCMYQIISFFDSDDAAQVVIAEKQNGGFLRMGRWLIRWLREKGGVVEGMRWEEWRIWETVVRTVHMVHVVNVVSGHGVSRSGGYEPLDDEAVKNLQLPCLAEVWQANSSVEWARARRKMGEVVKVTGRELINGGRMQEELRKYEGDDLMKVILACVGI